jgi:16S rRNA (guanine527-N7)-methyltransferase
VSPVSRETTGPDDSLIERLFGPRTALIHRYVGWLLGPGTTRGLVGPREGPRIWPRHILNCVVVAPVFGIGATVCDLGSGAGLPGVVLGLARPDLQVTLLEPLLRRVTFLGEVVADLGLDNVQVRRGRAEELAGREVFDAVTARAVARLDTLAGWGLPLVRSGGEVVALKGSGASTEVEQARSALTGLGATRVEIESYGEGVVDPLTTVVRIESGGKPPVPTKGSR